MHELTYLVIYWSVFPHVSLVKGHGFMLLYRPRDISKSCAVSQYLRYDLSFGMGMSDTITLVFRSMSQIDYECTVDIVAESSNVYLLIVVRYPNLMGSNCEVNGDAITVLKKNRCLRLCDYMQDPFTTHVIFPTRERMRFRFISNSSVNADMNAYLYQVTATAARHKPSKGCYRRNETICTVDGKDYCFTSGVVCDGIKNCGVNDWFDERKALCGLPVEKLDVAPVIAVAAALLCAFLAASHVLLRCLPPRASSFFIFNANEDNRLRIDPVIKPRGNDSFEPQRMRQVSLIPVSLSSSSESEVNTKSLIDQVNDVVRTVRLTDELSKEARAPRRKITMKMMTAKIQETFRYVTGSKSVPATIPLDDLESKTENV